MDLFAWWCGDARDGVSVGEDVLECLFAELPVVGSHEDEVVGVLAALVPTTGASDLPSGS